MTLPRRPLLLAAAAWAALPARADDVAPAALRAAAESALEQGDLAAAQRLLERAAGMAHEAPTEMALARTAMQDGRYRQALALAAHTAGGHAGDPAAALLYAWLLAVGGRSLIARRIHAEALRRFPGHPLLEAASGAFDGPAVPAAGTLLAPPHRLAPYAWGDSPATAAPALCAGFTDGVRAWVPLAPLSAAQALWVRSALGPTVRVRAKRVDPALGVAMLELERPLAATGAVFAGTEPPPGSPVAAVASAGSASPAWPWLFAGFAGRVALGGGPRSADLDTPGCVDGAVVVDGAGRIAGLLVQAAGAPRWVSPAALLRAFGVAEPVEPTAAAAASRLAVDALYEAALMSFVQVLPERDA